MNYILAAVALAILGLFLYLVLGEKEDIINIVESRNLGYEYDILEDGDGNRITEKEIKSEDENMVMEEGYRIFKDWFNERELKYLPNKRKMYTAPYAAAIEKEDGKSKGRWFTKPNDSFEDPSKIIGISRKLGRISAEQGINPNHFIIALDGELWPNISQKYVFRYSELDGETTIKSVDVLEDGGSVQLPENIGNTGVEISRDKDITLSAANAFWVGAGMGVQHRGPEFTVSTESGEVNLGDPDSHGTRSNSSSAGTVYVLTNSALSNAVKIGYTTRSAEKRAREVSSGTGVVGRWEVAHEIESPRPKRTEKEVHKRLSDKKVQGGGEFFRIDPEEAARVIKKVRG